MNNAPLMEDLQSKLRKSFHLVRSYDWLIDAYILDFYVDNHWDRLPPCWRSCLDQLDIRKLKDLLTEETKPTEAHAWPLSILAIRVLLQEICLNRKLTSKNQDYDDDQERETAGNFQARQRLFNKSVKLKKRHEIEQFSRDCWMTGRRNGVQHLVDIGSGLGNLARSLAYGFGFKVCCIEQDAKLVEVARLKDEELSSRIKRQFKVESFHHPIHLSKKVNLEEIDPGQFVEMIRDSFNVEKEAPFAFGLIGLHPCGDLAVFLTKLFLSCPEAKFIKLVCCCYMKLSTQEDRPQNYGFPLSAFNRKLGLKLSYQAREIACHAIEQFHQKLETDYEELKVHAFRGAAEAIIVKLHPELKHSGVRSTKVGKLSFQQYCDRATSGMGIVLPQVELESEETQANLDNWERVAKFYTLRLMFAPLIESIALYDRWLFLLEQGISSEIEVIFDPICSPRNHALTGCK